MFGSARQAYENGTKATESSRLLESAALFKVARMLDECRSRWDSPDRDALLREALQKNLRLWSLFQAELARPDHDLPVPMRIDLLRISSFIDRRTAEILADPAPEKLQALIEIDRQIGAGLTD